MNDERFLTEWLRDTADPTTDPNATVEKIVARLPDTPQRRRWLPWLPARRPRHDEPDGRTQLMFSPTQAIVAGAFALVVSGAALLASPLGDQSAPAPGAEVIGSGEIASFEGFIGYDPTTQRATREELDNGVVAMREQVWTIYDAETSDPRFSGTIINTWNWDEYGGDDGFSVWTGGWTLENDEGGWRERPQVTFGFPDETFPVITTVFDGVGGYEGLIAIAEIDEDLDARGFHIRGVITDGSPPPVPSLLQDAATE